MPRGRNRKVKKLIQYYGLEYAEKAGKDRQKGKKGGNQLSNQETRECLLCLRVPLERIRETVVALLLDVDQDVAGRVAERAAKLIAAAYEKDRPALCGKKPSSLMAAAIYLSARMEKGVKISQAKIAEALNVTEVTLRTRASQIKDLVGLDIPKFPDRRERYVCPFCEEVFTSLIDLKTHLWRKKIKPSSTLKVGMFNDDGVLVHKLALERMKRRLKPKTE